MAWTQTDVTTTYTSNTANVNVKRIRWTADNDGTVYITNGFSGSQIPFVHIELEGAATHAAQGTLYLVAVAAAGVSIAIPNIASSSPNCALITQWRHSLIS
jgi:hypothetical protein